MALLVLLVVVGAVAFIVEQALLLLPFGLLFAVAVARQHHARPAQPVRPCRPAWPTRSRMAASTLAARRWRRSSGAIRPSSTQAGVARAAIESLAENFSDGVVAPTFFMVIAGLPGAALYKAINTADSMIGHRTERHQDFGRTAAQLDDIVNLPASRLSALLIVAAACLTKGASASAAWHATWRDGPKHASPNAGYPEAAMAGALGLALGGPARLSTAPITDGAWMGDGRREATRGGYPRRARSLQPGRRPARSPSSPCSPRSSR